MRNSCTRVRRIRRRAGVVRAVQEGACSCPQAYRACPTPSLAAGRPPAGPIARRLLPPTLDIGGQAAGAAHSADALPPCSAPWRPEGARCCCICCGWRRCAKGRELPASAWRLMNRLQRGRVRNPGAPGDRENAAWLTSNSTTQAPRFPNRIQRVKGVQTGAAWAPMEPSQGTITHANGKLAGPARPGAPGA